MVFVEGFDFERIFVNIFAGSVEIFTLISFLVLGAMMAAFRIPRLASFGLIALLGITLSVYFEAGYVLIIIIAGMLSAHAFLKLMER